MIIKTFEQYRGNTNEPIIEIDGNDVNYQLNLDSDIVIEIEGKLMSYNSGRAIEYKFEPGVFTDDESESYWDNNWEDISDEILNKFYSIKK